MAKNHGSSVKDDEQYEAMRKKGASKEKRLASPMPRLHRPGRARPAEAASPATTTTAASRTSTRKQGRSASGARRGCPGASSSRPFATIEQQRRSSLGLDQQRAELVADEPPPIATR